MRRYSPFSAFLVIGIVLVLVGFANQFLNPAHAQVPVVQGGAPPTFRASFSVSCGGAGDCVTLYSGPLGASVREVYITKPGGSVNLSLIKRSSTDSGGTSSALSAVKFVTANAAPVSTARGYTAAPSAGSSLGTLMTQAMATTDTLVQDFGALNGRPLVLSGTSEGLALYVDGAVTLTGYLEWTEP